MSESPEQTVSRLNYFDLYRGFGILLMVMGHIGFGKQFDVYIHAFHMPLFFLVSGYFTVPEKEREFLPFLKHIARTLLVPYLAFAVLLCQPLHYIYTREFDLQYMLLSLVTSNHNRIDVAGAYWFLLCLFSCKVLFWCVLRIPRVRFQLLAVAVLSAAGMAKLYKLPLCLDSAMAMTWVMYAGFLMRQYRELPRVEKLLEPAWWKIAALLLCGAVPIFVNVPVNIRCNYYGNVLLFLPSCLLTLLGYLALARKLDDVRTGVPGKFNKIMEYVGRNSIVFLVLNEVAIYGCGLVLRLAGFKVQAGQSLLYQRLWAVGVLILTMICLALATEVFNRTKFKVLLGRKI